MGQLLSQPVTEKHIRHSDHPHLGYAIGEMQGYRLTMEDAYCETIEKLQIINNNDNKKHHHHHHHLRQENAVLKVAITDKEETTISQKPLHYKIDEPKELLINIFGVFDGHGGSSVSNYISHRLPIIILQNINRALSKIEFNHGEDIITQIDIPSIMKKSFLQCDNELCLRDEKSGSTAIIMILIKDQIIVANTGDSRCIMSTNGMAKTMSFDHKPGNYGELLRIHQDGGYVSYNRVNGILALSRAFGDFTFKNHKQTRKLKPLEEYQVTVDPELMIRRIDYATDEFIILACDGIWDCFRNKDLINFVRNLLSLGKKFDEIIEIVLDECLKMANTVTGVGFDNMTIIIILLFNGKENILTWYDRVKNKILDEKFGRDGH